ncbi:MGMT family protein [Bacillus infantis]|uniref:MGMT family protein n=1 Tax=Bacillus infantis TaxID=324767 RepID=UPI003CE8024A
MQPFTQRTIKIIKEIPAGKVMTYGQIAALAGSPRAARQVVRILHSLSRQEKLPWHRVISKMGEISIKDPMLREEQRFLLEAEGITVDAKGIISLENFLHEPKKGLDKNT